MKEFFVRTCSHNFTAGGGTTKIGGSLDPAYTTDESQFTVIGSDLYFVGSESTHGFELFNYNGSTLTAIDIRTGTASSNPGSLTVFSSKLYLTATDGTSSGKHGVELWSVTGTSATVIDIRSGTNSSSPGSLQVLGSNLYFTADTPGHGRELWKFNGTSASMVADINTSATSSDPSQLMTNGTTLFFVATDATHGTEARSTTGSGAMLLKDFATGNASSYPTLAAIFGGKVVLAAADDYHGNELWLAPADPDYTDLYYISSWQMIEERINGASDASAQYVFSPVYVDALLLRDKDTTAGGNLGKASSGLDQRIYYQQDANYNVTAITNASGVVQERYLYAPYGEVTITDASYSPRSPNVSTFEVNNLFQSKRYDSAVFVYDSRMRPYSVTLGWLGQDPAGTPDGPNRYASLVNNPIIKLDPMGLATINFQYAQQQRDFAENRTGATSAPTMVMPSTSIVNSSYQTTNWWPTIPVFEPTTEFTVAADEYAASSQGRWYQSQHPQQDGISFSDLKGSGDGFPNWRRYCGEKMEKDVIVLDYDKYANAYNWWSGAFVFGEHNVKNIDDVIRAVKDEVGDQYYLRKLIIIGHGSPGQISVGAVKNGEYHISDNSMHYPEGRPHWDQFINIQTVYKLAPLREYFSTSGDAKIVFVGCNVGGGLKGAAFLQAVADTLPGVLAIGYTSQTHPLTVQGGNGFLY